MNQVLVIEDHKTTAGLITQYIKNIAPDLETVVFSEAAKALQFAREEHISIFIIDIQLTDYKGSSLARQLRALPEYKYTPIIFETALAGEELLSYRELKCFAFLVKPFSEEEFRTVFCDALGLADQMKTVPKTIQIEQKQFVFEYDIADIAFVEAYGKQIIIHTNSKWTGAKADKISGYTLSRLNALIDDPSFVQCHKSFIVNKKHIERINKADRQIILKGSHEQIPVGSKYQPALWG